MAITGRDKYDMSFITKDSLRNQFRSDLTTPIPEQIDNGETQIHVFYAKKMGEKYLERYKKYFNNQSVEIGWLLKYSEWNKGYAKKLTEIMIEQAKSKGKSVIIECSPEQSVTRHIAELFKFQYQGDIDGCSVYRL